MTPTQAEPFRHSDVIAPRTTRRGAEDLVQCDGLNLEARYRLSQVTATAQGNDGRAELMLASHRFCGGGIDPQQLRIDFRQSGKYHQVRGELLAEVEGDEPFGGDRQDNPARASAAPTLRAHVANVWEAIKRGCSL